MVTRMSRQIRSYALLVFLIPFLIFNLNFRTIVALDSVPNRLLPFNILMGKGLYFDHYLNYLQTKHQNVYYLLKWQGHYISGSPIASGILSTPIYLPFFIYLKLTTPTLNVVDLYESSYYMEKISASFFSSLSVLMLFLLLLKIFKNLKTSFIFSLIYAFGTQAFSINSQGLWQHGIASFLMIFSQLLLFKGIDQSKPRSINYFNYISILLALLSAFTRPGFFIYLMLLNIVLFMKDQKNWKGYLFVSFAGIALILSYNSFFYQSLIGSYGASIRTLGGANMYFNLSYIPNNLLGLFFSPARGIIFYTPIFMISLLAIFFRGRVQGDTKKVFFYLNLVFFVSIIVLNSFWKVWWGGHSWGDRLLSDIAISGVILCTYVYFLNRAFWIKFLIILTVTVSIISQSIGAFYYPKGYWDSYPSDIDESTERLWSFTDTPLSRSFLLGPELSGIYRAYYSLKGLEAKFYTKDERLCELKIIKDSNFLFTSGYKKR